MSLYYTAIEPTASPAQGEVSPNLSALKGKKILVVDDDDLNLKFVEIMSRNWDMHLIYASDGKMALQILQKNPVDVILTDFQMNEMDGIELMRAMQSHPHLKNIPVIMMSSWMFSNNEIKDLEESGFRFILPKPLAPAVVQEKLNCILK